MLDLCFKKIILARWGITWKRGRVKMGRPSRRLCSSAEMIGLETGVAGRGTSVVKMARSERRKICFEVLTDGQNMRERQELFMISFVKDKARH